MFKVGDIVIHPGYGICKVKAIQNDELSDIEKPMYILKPNRSVPGNFRLLIPKEMIEKCGVHYPISKDKVPQILQILGNNPNNLSEDCERGYPLTKKKVKSGDFHKIAEAVRDLENQNSHRFSSIKEKLLQFARKMLSEEIAYVKHLSKKEVDKLIDNALKKK